MGQSKVLMGDRLGIGYGQNKGCGLVKLNKIDRQQETKMYEKEIESSEYQKLPDRGNTLIVEWYIVSGQDTTGVYTFYGERKQSELRNTPLNTIEMDESGVWYKAVRYFQGQG